MQDFKKIFYNSVGCNTAEIVVETNQKTLSVHYHLNDNPVQHIWQDIYNDADSFKMGITNGQNVELLLKKLNHLFEKTNQPIIELPVSQEKLNQLHSKFVDHAKEGATEDEFQINLLIHALESKNNNDLTEFDTTVKFYKSTDVRIPIKEEYKLWLTTDHKWGDLLLGFATLGKPWDEIARTNDNLDDLNIQKNITSETLMFFNAGFPYLKAVEKQFYSWAKSSKYNVPLDNLNNLALGHYILGEVIVTDTFLDFHPIISDWYVPNHACKLKWGRDVLGYDAKIKEIKFFNSDIYYDTLVSHAKLDTL